MPEVRTMDVHLHVTVDEHVMAWNEIMFGRAKSWDRRAKDVSFGMANAAVIKTLDGSAMKIAGCVHVTAIAVCRQKRQTQEANRQGS